MAMLKICGVKERGDLAWLDGAVDYIGFVHTTRESPRSVDPLEADSMASTISRSKPVLVVNGLGPRDIVDLATRLGYIRVIQIHEPLEPATAAGLARMIQELGLSPAPVAIWAGSWQTHPCELEDATKLSGARVEYILVDRAKGHGPLPPGAIVEAGCVSRLGIAGGMSPERVCRVQATPVLVDASSWPERRPGAKDPKRVLRLKRSVERCLP